jgi:hypothetical protein
MVVEVFSIKRLLITLRNSLSAVAIDSLQIVDSRNVENRTFKCLGVLGLGLRAVLDLKPLQVSGQLVSAPPTPFLLVLLQNTPRDPGKQDEQVRESRLRSQ